MKIQATTELPATNEIVSALLAGKYAGDKSLLKTVKANPQKALNGHGMPITVRAVQNTEDTLHICVPAYHALDDMKIDDEQLAQVAGGEIILAVIIGAVAFTGITCAAVGLGVTLSDRDKRAQEAAAS